MKTKVLISWSGGKDCSLALYEIVNSGDYIITALFTTITDDYDRVSMHGLRRELLEQQISSMGQSLEKVLITKGATNLEYQSALEELLSNYKDNRVVFGDIFLEDIKNYREEHLGKLGMKCIFPVWGIDSKVLAERFIELGFKAIIICVDSEKLGAEFAGRDYDESLLADLPEGIDPCGENGEFHTFVYDGPLFRQPVRFETGEVVLRDGRFYYCDLIPKL